MSEPANTCTAILAGSGRATDLLLVALIDAVDDLMKEHEARATRATLRSFMIVDDVRFVLEGEEEAVAAQLPKLAQQAVRVLEENLHMCVSRDAGQVEGRTVAQASKLRISRCVKPRLARLGTRVVSKVKHLGALFVAGGKRGFSNQVAARRYSEGLKKLGRARALGRAARQRVVRSVLTPSFTFGASAVSCPLTLVRQLRTQSARTFGPVDGRSVSTRLMLESIDVGEVLVTKAVMAWVNGLWDQLVESRVMQRAWRHACACNLAEDRRARGSVSGAAAYLASVDKLGWTTPSFDSIRTRQGIILYIGAGAAPEGTHAADPALVRRFVGDEYEQQMMASSIVGKDLADLSRLRGSRRMRAKPQQQCELWMRKVSSTCKQGQTRSDGGRLIYGAGGGLSTAATDRSLGYGRVGWR